YVYYGGAAPDAVADLVFSGEATDDFFGMSVGTAGDTNGDGYDDVIVGAPWNDAGGSSAGRAYVYHGGPGADAIADLVLTGGSISSQLGKSVKAAGDVNGDGYADVIVGAPTNSAGGTNAGRAYVYYCGPGADAIADVVLTGTTSNNLGGSVSGAGDVNRDGFSDLIVGVPGSNTGGLSTGAMYLYDMNRYHLLSPIGGETWNVGATKTITWLGAEPAMVSLSTDGGQSYQPLLPSSSGGAATNAVTVRVPHTPTKFARVRVTTMNSQTGGSDQTDSLFTIQTSVSLLSMLAARLPHGGATISWQSDPGPEDLSGYRLEKGSAGSSEWRTLVALTRETSVTDPEGGPGSRYRLLAVNGFGEELLLGEASLRPERSLAAWPLPYRGGPLTISFATGGGLGGGLGAAEVSIFDVSGRLVRRIAKGEYTPGYQVAQWDGRDGRGRSVASGIYFLRSMSGGEKRTLRLSVLR
ncbi:MAG TPA: FlgD immunoglobulin-like domain containing protein, partial [Candidatus Eisenbacteria bacterium]|nr:FlgD immunoglobulin-like domain containing protein [Candidatus Eisenbacteria bacterium]